MANMLWFGLLVLASVLLGFTGFADADVDETPADEKDMVQVELNGSGPMKEEIPPVNTDLPLPAHGVHEHGQVTDDWEEYQAELMVMRQKGMNGEEELILKMPGEEAVHHMEQVAEDFKLEKVVTQAENIEDLLAKSEENGVDDLEVKEEDENVVEEEIQHGGEEGGSTQRYSKDADDTKNEEILQKVGMLRKSDRSGAENLIKHHRRVFVIPKSPPAHFPEFVELEVEEEDHQEVIFVNSDSHVHVVHKNTDYAMVVPHEEF